MGYCVVWCDVGFSGVLEGGVLLVTNKPTCIATHIGILRVTALFGAIKRSFFGVGENVLTHVQLTYITANIGMA